MVAAGRLTRRARRFVAGTVIVGTGAAFLVAVPGVATADAPESPASSVKVDTTRTVLMYGDSLSRGSSQYIERGVLAQRPQWDVVVRALAGTAICDFFETMREDADLRPDLVVLQFSGNTFTECMADMSSGSAEALDKYRDDATQAARFWSERGIRVLFVGSPRPYDEPLLTAPHPLDAVYQDIAEEFGKSVSFSDAPERALTEEEPASGGAAVFSNELPCLPNEAWLDDCADGDIEVRAPDGMHFCPVDDPFVFPCPVYAPGSKRFGEAIAGAVVVTVR